VEQVNPCHKSRPWLSPAGNSLHFLFTSSSPVPVYPWVQRVLGVRELHETKNPFLRGVFGKSVPERGRSDLENRCAGVDDCGDVVTSFGDIGDADLVTDASGLCINWGA
jgi:hypothetical protein